MTPLPARLPVRRIALVAASALLLALSAPASAAQLDLRTADRLDLAAPTIVQYAPGTSSIVAVVGYRDLGRGATISLDVLDPAGARVAGYREPVAGGGSGTAVARLIASGPLANGVYTVRASVDGAESVSANVAVGQPAPQPTPAGSTPRPGGVIQLPPTAEVAGSRPLLQTRVDEVTPGAAAAVVARTLEVPATDVTRASRAVTPVMAVSRPAPGIEVSRIGYRFVVAI